MARGRQSTLHLVLPPHQGLRSCPQRLRSRKSHGATPESGTQLEFVDANPEPLPETDIEQPSQGEI